MIYNIEEIVQAIKTARRDKGLSQRALSDKVGIPQSHISKIEKGDVNIKISTLSELARALDLEIILVPRKVVPAVKSITRSVQHPGSTAKGSQAAKNQLTQIRKSLKEMHAVPEAFKEIQKLQQAARELSKVYALPASSFDQFRQISETLRAFNEGTSALNEFQKAAKSLQSIRNQIMHGIPKMPLISKPAYSLDENDDA